MNGMASPVYRLSGLVKEYEGRRVLDIESLDVQPGEILAIVGPSGAGKSTLLRILGFLEPPTTGSLSFQGQELLPGRDISLEARRRVTLVFQRPMLLGRSVWDNVTYGLRLRGNWDARRDVEAALKMLGLQELASRQAARLSGGEAQRTALARAIVLQPDVLLLDEPTANLDPYNVGLIESITCRMNNERQTTVVLVTHNVFQARRLAHRTALMLNGKLVEIAEADRFFESPSDPRTNSFVRGDMVY